jgi:transposase
MAPNLAAAQHAQIRDMIADGGFYDTEIADAVECSRNAVGAIRANIQCFGRTNAPRNVSGPRRSITPSMHEAMLDFLLSKPEQYLDELVVFIWDEFEVLVSTSTVSRELKSVGWSKKRARQEAAQRDPDLRDYYLHEISSFDAEHLVFVDESGCDKRCGFRRTGWSPLGVTPVQVARFQRGELYQILPAYTVDGVLTSQIFQGSTDSSIFEDFIQQLLSACGRWPERHSVLVMDNASFHHSERITELCREAGVKLVYLPPYSPDLNPIEEFFAELKRFVKRNWVMREENPDQDFSSYLQWCVDVVGAKGRSAKGHFRHSGLVVEDL